MDNINVLNEWLQKMNYRNADYGFIKGNTLYISDDMPSFCKMRITKNMLLKLIKKHS